MAIPQGPWNNPTIPAGIYDAEIRYLADGKYHGKKDRYIQVVMWLPQVQDYFVSNLYFPHDQPDAKTVQRLARLCQCVGLLPQDAVDNPQYFRGQELKVQIGVFTAKNGHEYRDVELFLHREVIVMT